MEEGATSGEPRYFERLKILSLRYLTDSNNYRRKFEFSIKRRRNVRIRRGIGILSSCDMQRRRLFMDRSTWLVRCEIIG